MVGDVGDVGGAGSGGVSDVEDGEREREREGVVCVGRQLCCDCV